ncbi:MAG TPA: hypothetical protein VGO80_06370 [Solirubrobacteraceae bacterium]|jgi:hypothetical protein|nr:hypothetical protein [Solirubrobacteraceae bacterium]
MTTSCSDPPLDDRPPQRTWLTPGDPFTANDDRARVTAVIAELTWHVRTDDLLVPATAALAIANAARQLGLPPITHVAFDGALEYPDGSETATYALYGVQCTYPRHGPARLYLLDTGTSLITLAHDTWPTPAATARNHT